MQYSAAGVLIFERNLREREVPQYITPDSVVRGAADHGVGLYVGTATTGGTHPGCGGTSLNTVAQYDRGLGVG